MAKATDRGRDAKEVIRVCDEWEYLYQYVMVGPGAGCDDIPMVGLRGGGVRINDTTFTIFNSS